MGYLSVFLIPRGVVIPALDCSARTCDILETNVHDHIHHGSRMPRHFDLSALRSFLAVAETGGVTRAAGLMNLTQSAVSMQIRRIEDQIGRPLFDRTPRGMVLTGAGELLLGHARRLLDANDEAMARLAGAEVEGTIRLGVPPDVVHPVVPDVLRQLAACFPRVRVTLTSALTIPLRAAFARGEFDLILTTEAQPGPGGAALAEYPLVWVGAPEGQAARRRPLRVGFTEGSYFRGLALAALEAAGTEWEVATDGGSDTAIEAMAVADLLVTARLADLLPRGMAPVDPRAGLPPLPAVAICAYAAPTLRGPAAAMLRDAFDRAYRPGRQAAA
jgi:DNA-binding transcriptional LysR family regulator